MKIKKWDQQNKSYHKAYREKHKEKAKAYQKIYRAENVEKLKENRKRYYLNHADRILQNRKASYDRTAIAIAARKYGITVSDYHDMAAEQKGLCKLCGSPPCGRRLYIDHDHELGFVRGLLCRKCNAGLGFFNDSVQRLIAAVKYLTHNKRIKFNGH